jgi:hypothetical protein
MLFDKKYLTVACNVTLEGLIKQLSDLPCVDAIIHVNGNDLFSITLPDHISNRELKIISSNEVKGDYLTWNVKNVNLWNFVDHLSLFGGFKDARIKLNGKSIFYIHVAMDRSIVEISDNPLEYDYPNDDIHIQINGSIMSTKERSIVEFCDKRSYKLDSQDGCVSADNGEPV